MPSLQLSVPGQDVTSVSRVHLRLGQARLLQVSPQRVERLLAHPPQRHVLLLGEPGAAAGVLAGDLCQQRELVLLDVALGSFTSAT